MTSSAPDHPDAPGPIQGDNPPTWSGWLAGTGAVAAVYVYFLIFAQFAFLKLLQAAGGGSERLKSVMIVMGAGGLAASAGMAWIYHASRGRHLLTGSLGIAAVAAVVAIWADTPAGFFAAAALTGLGTGGATVALAPQLRAITGPERLGSCVGWGTGLAYGICNLPGIFDAAPRAQAVIAVVAAALGIIAVLSFPAGAPQRGRDEFSWRLRSVGIWTVIFLVLVWLDSAAFYVIQHTPAFQERTWAGDTQLYLNGAAHCAMGVLAGWALNRGWGTRVILGSAVLLGSACWLLRSQTAGATTALLYASGVSLYSTALVYYPASRGQVAIAAIVYGVAGWIGSGLGIAMAEGWHEVPGWFLAAAGGVLAMAVIGHRRGRRSRIR